MGRIIQDLRDQVWQHSTTLVYALLGGDRFTGSIEETGGFSPPWGQEIC
jgi:hypothetical protein